MDESKKTTNKKQESTASVSYEVGQIVYILSNKTTKIVPAVVAKEIVEKTLEGYRCQWTVFVGPEDKRKSIEVSRIDGEVFSSIEKVEHELRARILSFADAAVRDAKSSEEAWYKDINDKKSIAPSSGPTDKVDLDDFSNFEKVDSENAPGPTLPQQQTPKKTTKSKTRIIMPDGTVAALNDE